MSILLCFLMCVIGDTMVRSKAAASTYHAQILPVWYVVLLSLLSIVESNGGAGGKRWGIPPFLSRANSGIGSCNELATVPPSPSSSVLDATAVSNLRGGAALNPFPSGYHPFGYGLTDLGKRYLDFDGSLDSDVGRFLATLKGGKRKSADAMKEQWLEVVRVSKKAQSMRVYRQLDDLISFCLKAGFLD